MPKYIDPTPFNTPNRPKHGRRLLILTSLLGLIAVIHFYPTIPTVSGSFFSFLRNIVTSPEQGSPIPNASSPSSAKLVPLEAHIMSKCPDARDCILELLVPVMSQIASHINFTLSYIGQPTDLDDGVSCMHGPTECLGNIIQLCAEDLYDDPKQWFGFTMCMERSYEHIPERWLVQSCAAEYGLDFWKLNHCASKEDGAYGIGLLRDSVEHTADKGVTTSCTVSNAIPGVVICSRLTS
jgi:hypothetical protein